MHNNTNAPNTKRSKPTCSASTQPRLRGDIVLDSKGIIRSCSSKLAQVAGLHDVRLIGKNARRFIPELPFRPETEGYNVALSMFMAERGDLQRWSFISAEGNALPMSVHVFLLKLQTGFAICLDLEYPAADALDAANTSNRYNAGIDAATEPVQKSNWRQSERRFDSSAAPVLETST